MAPTNPSAETIVYYPNEKKSLIALLFLLGISVFLFLMGAGSLKQSLADAKPFNMADLASLLLGIALFLFCLLALLGSIKKRPQLILSKEGIAIKGILGTQTANWDSLLPFEWIAEWNVLRAPIVGNNVNKGLSGKAYLQVTNSYNAPIGIIAAALNARRAEIWNALPPEEVNRMLDAFRKEIETSPIGTPQKKPWLTYALLITLCLIFAVEMLGPGSKGTSPGMLTLLVLGALAKPLVLEHQEWFRLFTAPLLHGSLLHLMFNSFALLIGGSILERMIGRSWFLALFSAGALGGSLMSLTLMNEKTVSIGASGAVLGLFAAICVLSLRLPKRSPEREKLQLSSFQVLIPSLLPFMITPFVIDYGAHLGGALSGGLLAYVILKNWDKKEALPGAKGLSRTLALVGSASFLSSIGTLIARLDR